MYSPVFLSWPTTSGSPPVLAISLSDHSFAALASSFACTLSHSRPLWRSMFFSKRAFNVVSSSSCCFFERATFDIVVYFKEIDERWPIQDRFWLGWGYSNLLNSV